jgi:hypothetical protein
VPARIDEVNGRHWSQDVLLATLTDDHAFAHGAAFNLANEKESWPIAKRELLLDEKLGHTLPLSSPQRLVGNPEPEPLSKLRGGISLLFG